MNLTKLEKEQLANICEMYPVWSGDLISKHAKASLLEKGLIKHKAGHGISNTSDGERLAGYVPTDLGLKIYMGESE